MQLHFPLFFLLDFFPEDIFVLRVGLREVAGAKALAEFQLAAALGIALDDQLDAPLDFGRRTLSAAAEELVVLDLELADVFFELRQFFVDRSHGGRSPRFSMLGAVGSCVNKMRGAGSRFGTMTGFGWVLAEFPMGTLLDCEEQATNVGRRRPGVV